VINTGAGRPDNPISVSGRGNKIFSIHIEKFNNMQKFIKILLFHIYMKLNMYRTTHSPSSGA
jgi:hypothetical protein